MDEFDDPEIANYLKELERLSQEVQEEKKIAKQKKANNNNNNNNQTINAESIDNSQIGPQIPPKPQQMETQIIAKAPVKMSSNPNLPFPSVGPAMPFDMKKNKIGQIPDISEVPLPAGYNKSNAIQSYAPEIPSPFVAPILPMPTPIRKQTSTQKETKVKGETIAHVRKKGEFEWEDPTLNEWDTNDFRIFVGDLGNEVSEETLKQAFLKYPSLLKVRVVHDKKNKKSKGFGFVSLSDPTDFLRAMKEMDGVYVGNRPIKLRKSKWKDRLDVDKIKKIEKKMKRNQKTKTRAPEFAIN